jgi:hypothetical protein
MTPREIAGSLHFVRRRRRREAAETLMFAALAARGNTMLTPVLFNGILKLQVSMIPWEHLIAFTALYCGLYMGGHTVKAIFGERLPAQ